MNEIVVVHNVDNGTDLTKIAMRCTCESKNLFRDYDVNEDRKIDA